MLVLSAPDCVHGEAPIVMVPGLAGSVIKGSLSNASPPYWYCPTDLDEGVLWVNIDEILPIEKDCLLWMMKPHFNATDGTYYDTEGVTLETNVDFGGVDGITYVDPDVPFSESSYLANMVAFFEARGYRRGRDLHGAPYDWRMAADGHLAPGKFFEKLQTLIEKTVATNGAKASIVTHSLGGPTSLAFMNTRPAGWVDAHVANLVTIAAPWAGSVAIVHSLISGDSFGIPLVPSDYLKEVQATSASGVFLLPTTGAFGSRVLVSAGGTNYTAAELPQLMADLELAQDGAIWNNLQRLRLSAEHLSPPPVRTLVITSKGVDTADEYVYERRLGASFDDTPERVVYGDGDGTVNRASLRWGQDGGWPSTLNYSFYEVEGVAHFDMAKDESVLAAVASFLGVNGSAMAHSLRHSVELSAA